MRRTKILILVMLIGVLQLNAQVPNIDSLKSELNKNLNDTARCNILALLSEYASEEEWPKFNNALFQLSKLKLSACDSTSPLYYFYKKNEAVAISNFGILENNKGNFDKAIELYLRALKIEQKIGHKKGMAGSMSNLALTFQTRGDIQKALEYNSKSLNIREEIGDKEGVALSLNNLGLIYDSQGEYEKALEYFNKSIKICEQTGDKKGVAYGLTNIGYSYENQDQYVKGLEFLMKGLKILEEIGDKYGLAYALSNIGFFYSVNGDPSITSSKKASLEAGILRSLEFFKKGLKIRDEIGDKNGMAQSLNNIANQYLAMKQFDKASAYLDKAMLLGIETGVVKNIMSAARNLSTIHKRKGNFKAALDNFELFIQMRDSLNNESTRKASIKSQLKYEYEKQAAADSVAHNKESEIKNVQLQKQTAEIKAKKNQQYALFGGLGLVIIFAGFMYNRFKITQKQKSIIEEQKIIVEQQKHLVEEKQQEVMDSIRYAKRIQTALLPNEKFITRILERRKRI